MEESEASREGGRVAATVDTHREGRVSWALVWNNPKRRPWWRPSDLELLRAELRADLRELKLELIKWLGGTTIAMIGIAVAALSLILG